MGFVHLDVDETRVSQGSAVFRLGERAGDASGLLFGVGTGRVVNVGVGDDVGDRETAAGAQHTSGLSEHEVLVCGEVDDAVGDDDVNTFVGERYVFEVALDELDVGHARVGRVGAGEVEHLGGHVEPDGTTFGRHAPGGDQHVGAGAGPEVEHYLARAQVGHRGRHPATEGRGHGGGGRALDTLRRLEGSSQVWVA